MKRLKHIEKNKVHSYPFIYHPELIIKEMQIKMRYHFTPIKLAKTCTSDNPKYGLGCWERNAQILLIKYMLKYRFREEFSSI